MGSFIKTILSIEATDLATQTISVIIGGIFSCIGGYLAARRSARAQINVAAQSAFIPARISAFREFEAALESWCNQATPESYAAIYRTANALTLVASHETITALKPVLDYLRGLEQGTQSPSFDEFARKHCELLETMREDLLTYPVPKPLK